MKRILIIFFVSISLNSIFITNLHSSGFNPTVSNYFISHDNLTISLGNSFVSGDTISSSKINEKFSKLENILNQIIQYDDSLRTHLIQVLGEDNLTQKKYIFFTNTSYQGDLGGKSGAENKCSSDPIAEQIKNITGCSNIKVILETNSSTFQSLDSGNSVYFSPNGTIIARSWDEMLNLQTVNWGNFGGFGDTKVWTGKDRGGSQDWNCYDWSNNSQNYWTTALSNDGSTDKDIWSRGQPYCNEYHSLMCICD